MAYDHDLADRLRWLVADESEVVEKKMFGGLAFLLAGNMAFAASGQGGLLVRVAPAESETIMAGTGAVPMEMRGRPMKGWLLIGAEHLETEQQLADWVERAMAHVRTLPLK